MRAENVFFSHQYELCARFGRGQVTQVRSVFLLEPYSPLARFAFCCYKASYSRAAFLNVYACAKDTPASRAAILQLAPLKSALATRNC